MQAVWSKHVDLVRFLVGRGADVFARDNTGMPVIFYVFCLSSLTSRSEGVLRDMREIWRILVSAGVDLRAIGADNATILIMVMKMRLPRSCHSDIVCNAFISYIIDEILNKDGVQ
jgi:hypothetical protein